MRKPINYWTKERCLIEALKYNTITEFKHGAIGAYRSTRKNSWFNEATKHMKVIHNPNRKSWDYWNNRRRCLDVAIQCRTKTEFKRKFQGAWVSARKHGWLNDIINEISAHKPIIYGIKTGETFHYIGKSRIKVNTNNKINKSYAKKQYSDNRVREIFQNNSNVDVVQIKLTKDNVWYDEKLSEVVKKHKENHPLLNAQWMLEGKHGYWSDTDGYWKGKKRDNHTINRLSESKFKKIVEYDQNGKLVKIWNSGKQVAIEVFGDYHVINGSASTKLYHVLRTQTLKGKFRFNSYWFSEIELRKHFNIIPIRLNILAILEKEKQQKKQRQHLNYKRGVTIEKRIYTVVHYNQDGSIKTTYNSIHEAAEVLSMSETNIKHYCNNKTKNPKHILQYGEKTMQPLKVK